MRESVTITKSDFELAVVKCFEEETMDEILHKEPSLLLLLTAFSSSIGRHLFEEENKEEN